MRHDDTLVSAAFCSAIALRRVPRPGGTHERSPSMAPGRSRTASPPPRCPRNLRTRLPCPAWPTWPSRPSRTWTGSIAARTWPIASASSSIRSEWLTNYWKGKVDQDRNYFWYRKTFRAPAAQRRGPAQDQQGPVRHRRLAQRPEARRIRRLLHRQLLRPRRRHPLERREHARRPHRRASRPCCPTPIPTGQRLREDQVDARHLRQRVGDLLRQPGHRNHSGRAAHRPGRDRGADPAEEPRHAPRCRSP